MIEEAAPIAEDLKLLILESYPLRLHFTNVHHASPAQRLVDVQLDLHPKKTATSVSNRGSINLFNDAHGSNNGFGGGYIHSAEGKVVHLNPKRSSIEGSIIH